MSNEDIARDILDANAYVVLATVDEDGRPWASPVWFALEDYRELFWLSYPGARHSENIAARPQIAMVVFDSTAAPETGQAVYMSATVDQISDPDDIARGVGVVASVSARQGGRHFTPANVTGDARLRLYRAAVHDHWILDPDSRYDVRVAVTL